MRDILSNSFGRIALAAALALGATVQAGDLSRTDVMDAFSQGKELFRQANELVASDPAAATELYRKAAMRFERLAHDADIHNGKLFYNIGNAYFRTEDLGRAILNYRRAMEYLPNDPNVQQNLAYARARRLTKIEEKQKTRILKTVFFWHYDLSTRTRSCLFLTVYLAAWALAGAGLLWRRLATVHWPLVLFGLFSAALLGSLVSEAVLRSAQQPGVIVTDSVDARKGDAESYEKSFTEPLHAGTEFVVLEQRPDWIHIELPDGRRCWIPGKSVELVRSL